MHMVNSDDAVLTLSAITKSYSGTDALRRVDLRIEPGQLVGLLGPNGAGKSTLMKIACGLVRPTSGEVQIARPFGYLAELFRFPDWCGADELLTLHQRLANVPLDAGERRELLKRVRLELDAERKVGEMSKGMQQRLGIAQAMIGRPRLLLLDEPTSALDPGGRRTVRDLLRELKKQGVAVLLNTHLLSEVEHLCDRVVFIDRGAVVASGAPEELVQAAGVTIETDSGIQHHAGLTRAEVPALVAELVASGERIYGVRVAAASLEEIYLSTVADTR